jgi:hypothetical protein
MHILLKQTYFLNLIYFNTTRPDISHTHLINLFQYIYIKKRMLRFDENQ